MNIGSILSQGFIVVQFAACISAIYYWKNYKNTALWIFMPFLVYSFLNEFSALIMTLFTNYRVRPLYNIYSVISFFVYLYYFDRLLKINFWKLPIVIIFLITLYFDVLNNSWYGLYKDIVFVIAVMILVFSVIFYGRLLKSEQVIHYKKLPEFWIIMGLLLFYLAFIPLTAVVGLGYKILPTYYIAINILNYTLYCCYIIGFYVTGRQ